MDSVLGPVLPGKYDAEHWSLLWTGFDVVLLAVLGYAGWAAWFRRQILATTSIVAGTLLLCDAWFDIITSIGNSDEWLSLLTGFGIEIPLAVSFLCLYRHIILKTLEAYICVWKMVRRLTAFEMPDLVSVSTRREGALPNRTSFAPPIESRWAVPHAATMNLDLPGNARTAVGR